MKIYFRLLGFLCLGIIFSCNSEPIKDDSIQENYFRVTEFKKEQNNLNIYIDVEFCFNVDLIAGQHTTIGSLGVTISDKDLILTYTTISDWTIGTTHISIGDCKDQWVPITRSGNPKIGKFEHTEPHSAAVNRVVYHISLDALPEGSDLYCFAAHAEVNGPDGEETAWAGGDDDEGGAFRGRDLVNNGYTVKDFSGRSWATYVEALLSVCDD
jgi:hypothetical protein